MNLKAAIILTILMAVSLAVNGSAKDMDYVTGRTDSIVAADEFHDSIVEEDNAIDKQITDSLKRDKDY